MIRAIIIKLVSNNVRDLPPLAACLARTSTTKVVNSSALAFDSSSSTQPLLFSTSNKLLNKRKIYRSTASSRISGQNEYRPCITSDETKFNDRITSTSRFRNSRARFLKSRPHSSRLAGDPHQNHRPKRNFQCRSTQRQTVHQEPLICSSRLFRAKTITSEFETNDSKRT